MHGKALLDFRAQVGSIRLVPLNSADLG